MEFGGGFTPNWSLELTLGGLSTCRLTCGFPSGCLVFFQQFLAGWLPPYITGVGNSLGVSISLTGFFRSQLLAFLAGGRPGLTGGSQGLVGGGGAKIGSVQCSLAQDWSKFFALGGDWSVKCFVASGWSVGFSFLLGSLLVGGGWSAEFWLVSFLVSGGPALRGGP
uniref:Uncharacterized protein n=1 Tax=Fibrocapsa japonica TaxID=94617 RepID=A0A7S2V0Y0_9STRA|mmetsp:Transcript_20330/g.29411  ORF Transcript_20330/g.29411 Transcript_20330/m.29411 type:complete len:166 (+) Transcript_20330:1194-1691(+)